MKEFLIVLSMIVVVMFLIGAGANKLAETACFNQWNRSGMQVDYSFAGGCLIQLPNGKFVPTGALKYFGEEK